MASSKAIRSNGTPARFGGRVTWGALVTGVSEGSPAAKAGIQVEDVITRFNDQPVLLITLIVLYVGSQLVSSLLMMTATADKNQRIIMLVLPFIFVPFVYEVARGGLDWGPLNKARRLEASVYEGRTSASTIRRVGTTGRIEEAA